MALNRLQTLIAQIVIIIDWNTENMKYPLKKFNSTILFNKIIKQFQISPIVADKKLNFFLPQNR